MGLKLLGPAASLASHAGTKGDIDRSMSYSVLAANVVNSNATANTLTDVTGLSFPCISGQTVYFRFFIPYSAAATTTGSRWSINGAANISLRYTSEWALSLTAQTNNESLGVYNVPAAANASSAATAANFAVIEGYVNLLADGPIIARFASSVANSAITALAGAFVAYRRVL